MPDDLNDSVPLWSVDADGGLRRLAEDFAGKRGIVWDLAFAPDLTTLAVAPDDNTVVLWDLTDPQAPRQSATLTGPRSAVTCLAFSPDGRTLATGSVDGDVRLWNLSERSRPIALGPSLPTPGVSSLAFSPDGRGWLWAGCGPAVGRRHRPRPGPSLSGQ